MGRPVGSANKPKLISWRGGRKDPASFILAVMQDENEDTDTRMRAAIALLPYVHRRQPLEVEAEIEAALTVVIRRFSDA